MSTELPIAGQRPPERADAARNRARILRAAQALLAERHPCEISVDDVAAVAGVGKGTIYRRFGDRGGLMQALLDERERAFQAAVLTGPPPLGPDSPPGERLNAFLCAMVDQMEAVGELMAEAEAGPAWLHSEPIRFRHLHIRVLLNQARPDLDADVVATALLAPLSAPLYLHQRRELGYSVRRIKTTVRELAQAVIDRGAR